MFLINVLKNVLNFSQIGSQLAKMLPRSQVDYTSFLSKCPSPEASFFFEPVSEDKVRIEILSLANNKSHGFFNDSCPTQLLKYAHYAVITTLVIALEQNQ